MRTLVLLPLLLAAACGGTPDPPAVPAPDAGAMQDQRRPAATPAAQPPAEGAATSSGRFLLVQGVNPIATEDFVRTAGRFEATLQPAGPQPGLSYQARVAADATIDSLMVDLETPSGPQRLAVTIRPSGDSALVRLVQLGGAAPQERTVGTRAGAVFYLNPSPSMMEQIVRRARVIGGDSVTVPIFMPVGEGRTAMVSVTFPAPDSAVTSVGGVDLRMHVDAAGRLLGATVPSQQLTIEREDAAR